jgi:hypothetical protein
MAESRRRNHCVEMNALGGIIWLAKEYVVATRMPVAKIDDKSRDARPSLGRIAAMRRFEEN